VAALHLPPELDAIAVGHGGRDCEGRVGRRAVLVGTLAVRRPGPVHQHLTRPRAVEDDVRSRAVAAVPDPMVARPGLDHRARVSRGVVRAAPAPVRLAVAAAERRPLAALPDADAALAADEADGERDPAVGEHGPTVEALAGRDHAVLAVRIALEVREARRWVLGRDQGPLPAERDAAEAGRLAGRELRQPGPGRRIGRPEAQPAPAGHVEPDLGELLGILGEDGDAAAVAVEPDQAVLAVDVARDPREAGAERGDGLQAQLGARREGEDAVLVAARLPGDVGQGDGPGAVDHELERGEVVVVALEHREAAALEVHRDAPAGALQVAVEALEVPAGLRQGHERHHGARRIGAVAVVSAVDLGVGAQHGPLALHVDHQVADAGLPLDLLSRPREQRVVAAGPRQRGQQETGPGWSNHALVSTGVVHVPPPCVPSKVAAPSPSIRSVGAKLTGGACR
jgi:hypothetical protein